MRNYCKDNCVCKRHTNSGVYLRTLRVCSLAHCVDKHKAKGLCAHHYDLAKSETHNGTVEWRDKQRQARDGGHFLLLSKGYALARFLGSWERSHRLAWVYYNGPIPEGMVVHHKNGDKLDNRVENLELMTNGEHVSCHRAGGQ